MAREESDKAHRLEVTSRDKTLEPRAKVVHLTRINKEQPYSSVLVQYMTNATLTDIKPLSGNFLKEYSSKRGNILLLF